MIIAPEEPEESVTVECPYHHTEMEYYDFVPDTGNHLLTFQAKCKLCMNNVIVKVQL